MCVVGVDCYLIKKIKCLENAEEAQVMTIKQRATDRWMRQNSCDNKDRNEDKIHSEVLKAVLCCSLTPDRFILRSLVTKTFYIGPLKTTHVQNKSLHFFLKQLAAFLKVVALLLQLHTARCVFTPVVSHVSTCLQVF